MPASSSAVNTVPVGLCGELTRIARVRGVIAARTASRSTENRGPSTSDTTRRVAPAIATEAAYES
jgi:hypothetical protein